MGHINKVLQIPQGNDFVIRQDDKSNIILYTVQNGKLKKYQSSNELGMWENIDLTEQEFKLIDSGILEVDGDYSEDTDIILMNKLDETRIVVMPDDRPPHSYSSPYRLYYAYDTKKLYMNMADSWHFIASLDHNLLENNGKLSHDELETILDRLTERITNVEQGTSIENVATKDDLEELRELLNGNIAALKDYVDNTNAGTTTGGLQVVDTLPQDARNDYTAIVRNAGRPYMATKIMDKWFRMDMKEFFPSAIAYYYEGAEYLPLTFTSANVQGNEAVNSACQKNSNNLFISGNGYSSRDTMMGYKIDTKLNITGKIKIRVRYKVTDAYTPNSGGGGLYIWVTNEQITKANLNNLLSSETYPIVTLPFRATIGVENSVELAFDPAINGEKFITIGNRFNGMNDYRLRTEVYSVEII